MSFSYPGRVRFRCSRCALCCGDTETVIRHVLLLKGEAEQVSRVTSRQIHEFADRIEGREPYVFEMKKTAEEGRCLFLAGKTCGIYESRPLICRFYPFRLTGAKDEEYAFSCTEECPGIGEGGVLGKECFERLFRLACDKLLQT